MTNHEDTKRGIEETFDVIENYCLSITEGEESVVAKTILSAVESLRERIAQKDTTEELINTVAWLLNLGSLYGSLIGANPVIVFVESDVVPALVSKEPNSDDDSKLN